MTQHRTTPTERLDRELYLAGRDITENRLPAYAVRILALREALGVTQPRLAALLDVATETLCHWEAGRKLPNATSAAKLATLSRRPPSDYRDTYTPSASELYNLKP